MNGLSLGVPGVGVVSAGFHVCVLYSGPAERDRVLYPFLEEGLRHGDKCLCLIDDVEPALVRERAVGALGPESSRRSAQLVVERSSDAYLRSGAFSADDMVRFLSGSVDAAIAEHFTLLRAAGEMSWVLPGPPGWEDLFAYESSLNRVVEHAPAILMCLYDLRRFGAQMLIDVLRTHSTVLLDGTVLNTPHHQDPAASASAGRAAAAPGFTPVGTVADGSDRTDRDWGSLTGAELRVISRIVQGRSNRGVAHDLSVSPHTVDAHLKHIYRKLDIHSRVELTVRALQRRLPGAGR